MRATCILTAAGTWLLAVVGATWCVGAEPTAKEAAKAKPARPKITISKETTYITGPLRPDGYPDYLAALNELTSRGVTPENNAAVPFWQAVGPKSIPAELRPQFFKLLGIKELPEKGAYIVPLDVFAETKKEPGKKNAEDGDAEELELVDQLWEQYDRAASGPWSEEKYPILFAWLTANELPLRRIVEGVKRPRFYSPLANKEGEPLGSSSFAMDISEVRGVCRLLKLRAMLRLGDGKVDEAWQDLLACHRLARLKGHGPFLVDQLVAFAPEAIACQGDAALANSGKLTAKQAATYLSDLDKLLPLPRVVSVIDGGERLFALDALLQAAQTGPEPLIGGFGADSPEVKARDDAVVKLTADPRLDWGSVLREVNACYDRLSRAHQKPTHKQMREAVRAQEKAAADRGREAIQPATFANALAKNATPESLGRHLATVVWPIVGSATEAVLSAEIRVYTHVSLSRLAFALAGYRADHGKYPANLADLKPKYIAEIPKDLFTDKDLVYRPQDGGKGYVLYSVGPNGRDDGGLNVNDDWEKYQNVEPDKLPDDIAVRTPAAADRGASP